jgi:hypothetical protein
MKLRTLAVVFLLGLTRIIPAMAEDQVRLFKIVSPKDDVVVGVTAAELSKLGTGPELDNLARHLAQDGQMTVWQYAVRKDQSGSLQEAPLRRIAVFKNDMLRIEPYASPLPVIPPSE